MMVLRSSASKAIIIAHLTLAARVNTVLDICFLPSDQPSNKKKGTAKQAQKGSKNKPDSFSITKQAHMLRLTTLSSPRFTNLKTEKIQTLLKKELLILLTGLCEMENIVFQSQTALTLKKILRYRK